jgi:O-antigen/teichoic acid export membrane protein
MAAPEADGRSSTAVGNAEEDLPALLLQGSAWVFAGRTVGRALGLASGVVLARALSAPELGDFYLAFSLATLAAIVGRLGMDTPATRLVAESLAQGLPGRARSVLRQTLVFTAIGTVIVGAVSGLGGWSWLAVHGFGNHRLAEVVFAATALIVCAAFQGTLVGWFRGLQDMRFVVIFDELVPGGSFLVLLLVGWLVFGKAEVASTLELRASGFALAIVGVGLAMRKYGRTLSGQGRASSRQVAELGLTTAGTLLITAAVGSTSDLLVLGAFRPSRDVAAYGIAVSVVGLLSMPFLAMSTALGPQLAQLNATGARLRMENLIRGASSVVGVVTLGATILLIALAHPLITTIFGPEYARAAPVLMLLALAQAAFVLTGPCGLTLMMTGHHRPAFLLTALTAVASIGADVWAAPRYGPLGVAAASSSAVALDNVLTMLVARRLTGVWTVPRFRIEDLSLAAQVFRRAASDARGRRRRFDRGGAL